MPQELNKNNGAIVAWMGCELINCNEGVDIREMEVEPIEWLPVGRLEKIWVKVYIYINLYTKYNTERDGKSLAFVVSLWKLTHWVFFLAYFIQFFLLNLFLLLLLSILVFINLSDRLHLTHHGHEIAYLALVLFNQLNIFLVVVAPDRALALAFPDSGQSFLRLSRVRRTHSPDVFLVVYTSSSTYFSLLDQVALGNQPWVVAARWPVSALAFPSRQSVSRDLIRIIVVLRIIEIVEHQV